MSQNYPSLKAAIDSVIEESKDINGIAFTALLRYMDETSPSGVREYLEVSYANLPLGLDDADFDSQIGPLNDKIKVWSETLEKALTQDIQRQVERFEVVINDLKSDEGHRWPATIAKLEEAKKQFSQGVTKMERANELLVPYERRGPASPRAEGTCNTLNELAHFSRNSELLDAHKTPVERKALATFASQLDVLSEGIKNGAFPRVRELRGKLKTYVDAVTLKIKTPDTQTRKFREMTISCQAGFQDPNKVSKTANNASNKEGQQKAAQIKSDLQQLKKTSDVMPATPTNSKRG